MARDARTQVPPVPPRGHEALPQGRALPDREVRDRAPLVSAGRARPRPHQAERVPAPAAREAEGAPLLRPAREAVPQLLREGDAPLRRTGENLLRMLETRLDNVVYRLGFAGSRAQARQLVRHGHFQVNGRRVNIPSYGVRPNDVITMKSGSPAEQTIRDATDLTASVAPWLQADHDGPHRQGAEVARARRDRHAGAGIADRRALLQVTRSVSEKEGIVLATRTSLMDFQIPRIVHEEINEDRGVFVIEPLDRGFGYTFGNSLRRVLLSSLEGAAVTAVKIEGVAHEFTTLPGVREDVTDIILNLKNLIVLLHGESPEIEVHLSKKGAGRRHGRRHRGARRPRDPQPGPRDRAPRRQGQARDDADDRPRPRLRPGRAEPRPGDDDRRDPDRLDLLAGPARLVRRRGRARRSAHRLRQARPRRHDRRLDRAARRDRPGGRDPDPPARDLHRPREDRGLRRGSRRRGGRRRGAARARDGELPDRGARARRPLVQLPQARRHRDDRRPRLEVRERARRDPELRQEVDRGGQGDARRPRPDAEGRGARSRERHAPRSAKARSSAATRRTARRSTRTSRAR